MSTFGPIFSVFFLLFIGVLLRRGGILKQTDTHVINSLIIYATVPALAFGIFYGQKLSWTLAVIVVVGNLVNILSLAIARAVAIPLKLERPQTGAFMISSTYGNTTFMGIPVVASAFNSDPSALVVAMIFSELAMSLPVYTMGLWLACRYGGSHAHFKDIISPKRLPAIPAMALGVLLTPFVIPDFVLDSLQKLGSCTLALAMISVGLMLSLKSFHGRTAPIAIAAIMKLFLMPAIMWAALTLCGVTGVARQVTVLQAAMPNSIIAGVMAARGGSDGPFVAASTALTTIVSMATIPLVLAILK